MYYRRIESDPKIAKGNNENLKRLAADRMKAVAAKKKQKRG